MRKKEHKDLSLFDINHPHNIAVDVVIKIYKERILPEIEEIKKRLSKLEGGKNE